MLPRQRESIEPMAARAYPVDVRLGVLEPPQDRGDPQHLHFNTRVSVDRDVRDTASNLIRCLGNRGNINQVEFSI